MHPKLPPPPACLYVSGPITGMPNWNLPAFESACAALQRAGYAFTSPLENGLPRDAEWQEHMRADIVLMLQKCQAVVLLPGFQHSRGAMAELFTAHMLGIPAFLLDEVVR